MKVLHNNVKQIIKKERRSLKMPLSSMGSFKTFTIKKADNNLLKESFESEAKTNNLES